MDIDLFSIACSFYILNKIIIIIHTTIDFVSLYAATAFVALKRVRYNNPSFGFGKILYPYESPCPRINLHMGPWNYEFSK